ncbi:basic leucine zipper 34-like [Cucumis melo var. makuwa]|uniref:Basic leucine zipper 34-like n=1 Tax=Cucumis melo var. makuwa TaxID=1194695 RepID=A0A5A7UY89_CUCMM|nr:basic leucine zipper 34-like [Cucumis melo var. makuwa]TYJ97281.1 basic leucine zipper 34-like [Cucumis melo var. makuwa]
MEDYNLLQNQNHPPCNFQDIMELCSVSTYSTTPPVTIRPDNRCLVVNNSVSDWRRSFVIGCSREDEERRRPTVPLAPFGAGEMSSGGDGLGNVDGRNNSEQILYGRNIDPNMDPRKLKRFEP